MATPSSRSSVPERSVGKRKQLEEGQNSHPPLLSLKRRKETLFKKCRELTVKTDVQVCAICIGSDGEIDAWPDPEKAKAILMKYNELKFQCVEVHNGEMAMENYTKPLDSKLGLEKLSGESLMKLWSDLDSKLETIDEKIAQKLNSKATNFCNDEIFLGNITEPYYPLPWVSSVEPNGMNQIWEPELHYTNNFSCEDDIGSMCNNQASGRSERVCNGGDFPSGIWAGDGGFGRDDIGDCNTTSNHSFLPEDHYDVYLLPELPNTNNFSGEDYTGSKGNNQALGRSGRVCNGGDFPSGIWTGNGGLGRDDIEDCHTNSNLNFLLEDHYNGYLLPGSANSGFQ